MSISYRKLTENDLERFISMRISQLREEGATEDLDLVPALKDYYSRHLASGLYGKQNSFADTLKFGFNIYHNTK